jgi:hypothetical protein
VRRFGGYHVEQHGAAQAGGLGGYHVEGLGGRQTDEGESLHWGGGGRGEWRNAGQSNGVGGGGVNGGGVQVPPAGLDPYYGGGCWHCSPWGIARDSAAATAGAMIGEAAVAPYLGTVYGSPNSYTVGSVVTSIPPGCSGRAASGANYYVCNGTWFQPYFGNNGVYYRVVPPM